MRVGYAAERDCGADIKAHGARTDIQISVSREGAMGKMRNEYIGMWLDMKTRDHYHEFRVPREAMIEMLSECADYVREVEGGGEVFALGAGGFRAPHVSRVESAPSQSQSQDADGDKDRPR
jgi:hypothetical protein